MSLIGSARLTGGMPRHTTKQGRRSSDHQGASQIVCSDAREPFEVRTLGGPSRSLAACGQDVQARQARRQGVDPISGRGEHMLYTGKHLDAERADPGQTRGRV